MSIKHEAPIKVPEAAPQSNRRHRGVLIGAAVGVPVVVAGSVGAAMALSSGGGSAEAGTHRAAAHNLVIADDVCTALKGLVSHTITVGNTTATVSRVVCGDPSTTDQQANVLGSVQGGRGFDLSVNVFGDAESSAEPVAQASDDGYVEYLGSFSVASQQQMYADVTPITLNDVDAFYETGGKNLGGQQYDTAVLMTDGSDDISVQAVDGVISEDALKAVAGKVESAVFVPATS